LDPLRLYDILWSPRDRGAGLRLYSVLHACHRSKASYRPFEASGQVIPLGWSVFMIVSLGGSFTRLHLLFPPVFLFLRPNAFLRNLAIFSLASLHHLSTPAHAGTFALHGLESIGYLVRICGNSDLKP